MCKHQLAIIKASTNISWGVMLEFIGTYYESLCGEIEAMFELDVSIKPPEDGDVYEGKDYIDNSNFMKDTDKDMVDVTILGRDVNNFPI